MLGGNVSSNLQSINDNPQLPSLRNIRQSRILHPDNILICNSINNNIINNMNNHINSIPILGTRMKNEDTYSSSVLDKTMDKYWRSSTDMWNDLECGIVYPDYYSSDFSKNSFKITTASSNQYTHPFGLFSVSIHPVLTRKNALAIFYSFIPYIIGIVLFAWLLIGDSFTPAYALIMMITSSASSEFFLKNIFKSPRPPNSACASYGMPSSHCVTSYSILIWLLLENINALGLASGFLFKLFIIVITAPVPWARWYVEDHTIPQCIWGCIVGIIVGIIAFFMRIRFFYTNLIF